MRGFKNDEVAKSAWGDAYDKIPKSVFAYVAWHLANVASGNADSAGAAEARFLEEWKLLKEHGINAPTKKIEIALAGAGRK